jgi:CDGSH-type Zn-finger protein
MSAPMVAASTPISVELEQGKEYFYCACGRSADQPFCDGSHQGTGLSPLAFVAENPTAGAWQRVFGTQSVQKRALVGTGRKPSDLQIGQLLRLYPFDQIKAEMRAHG